MKHIFIVFFLGFTLSGHAENECVSDKSYEICLEQQRDEFKTIVLYRNNKVIGTWHNLISNHDTPEVSFDKNEVRFLFFNPPSISGFSIELDEQPYVNKHFYEYRILSDTDEQADSIILSSDIDRVVGSRPDMHLAEVPLTLVSTNKVVLITADKAVLRHGKNSGNQQKPYIVKGNQVTLLLYEDGQFFVSFESKGKFIKGWIYRTDIL